MAGNFLRHSERSRARALNGYALHKRFLRSRTPLRRGSRDGVPSRKARQNLARAAFVRAAKPNSARFASRVLVRLSLRHDKKAAPDWGPPAVDARHIRLRRRFARPAPGVQAPRSTGGETELCSLCEHRSREALSPPRQKSDPRLGAACRGGEREIRTLVGVLAQTRFPVYSSSSSSFSL